MSNMMKRTGVRLPDELDALMRRLAEHNNTDNATILRMGLVLLGERDLGEAATRAFLLGINPKLAPRS